MKTVFVLLAFFIGTALCQEAQKVLHVSTIPSYADIYINQLQPNHKNNPQTTSPAFIPITQENSQDNEILISLFKPEFVDTTIRVKLSSKDTSYLIVSLRPNYDKEMQEEQEKILKKRSNRNFGRQIMWGSIAPFLVSSISGIIAWNQISNAEDIKKKIENSPLDSEESFNKNKDQFKNYTDNADVAKLITRIGVSLGASLLAVGIILQF